jgi:hypothetical protein
MNASSELPGTWFGLQFLAALQLPPLTLVQEIAAAFAGETRKHPRSAMNKGTL